MGGVGDTVWLLLPSILRAMAPLTLFMKRGREMEELWRVRRFAKVEKGKLEEYVGEETF